MKNNPSAAITAAKISTSPNLATPSVSLESSFRHAWTRFWFKAADPIGLHRLRFLSGVLLIAWLLPLGGHVEAFFSMAGWADREYYIAISQLQQAVRQGSVPPSENVPPVPLWSIFYWIGANSAMVRTVYWLAIAVFALFALGLWTRITAPLTWVFAVSFLASPAASYDGDYLLGLLAFYLMVGYLLLGLWSRPQTPGSRILGWTAPWLGKLLTGKASHGEEPSYAANLALRLLQVHFAIVVVASALHKLQIGDWWRGMALWFPLHPPFDTTQESLQNEQVSISAHLFLLSLFQYVLLAWQLTFPIFAWRKSWRWVLLGGAAIHWLVFFFIFRLPLFGPIYFLGALSYLTAAEWHWISDKLGGLIPGFAGQTQKAVAKG
ncbi:MAG TPA: hypothetical protein VKE98_00805 [Gemmataceae bacterium]|nr:hypothetical protein [Gemmataceae bacterium]